MTEAGGLSLQPAVADDLDRLARLESTIFESPWSRSALAAEFEPMSTEKSANPSSSRLLLVGRLEGEIAGYAIFHRVLDECELLRLAVLPNRRGRGVGAALLTRGLAEMATAGVTTCRLEVESENAAAIHLYQRFGFVEEGRRRAYYRHGTDALLLVLKSISSP